MPRLCPAFASVVYRRGRVAQGIQVTQHRRSFGLRPRRNRGSCSAASRCESLIPAQHAQAADEAIACAAAASPAIGAVERFACTGAARASSAPRRARGRASRCAPRARGCSTSAALADLRLPLRRQALETLVIVHELFLLFRRHLLKPLDPFRRQVPPGRDRALVRSSDAAGSCFIRRRLVRGFGGLPAASCCWRQSGDEPFARRRAEPGLRASALPGKTSSTARANPSRFAQTRFTYVIGSSS